MYDHDDQKNCKKGETDERDKKSETIDHTEPKEKVRQMKQ